MHECETQRVTQEVVAQFGSQHMGAWGRGWGGVVCVQLEVCMRMHDFPDCLPRYWLPPPLSSSLGGVLR